MMLDCRSKRQHRFDFRRGDPSPKRRVGTKLFVDAHYPELALVLDYRERQHTEPVPHFDKPHVMTVSGCDRGIQRCRYDERRRVVLPAHGIDLVEVERAMLCVDPRHKLERNREEDITVLRKLLARWARSPKS
ncbi:MAG: hypothetical protein KatS3mg073_1644 [Meiothermus sp.]|nr:MAG: hypothetical protein KatS3mg073_1644 [Meiothermus sp.]